jgi:hypothetical protein
MQKNSKKHQSTTVNHDLKKKTSHWLFVIETFKKRTQFCTNLPRGEYSEIKQNSKPMSKRETPYSPVELY